MKGLETEEKSTLSPVEKKLKVKSYDRKKRFGKMAVSVNLQNDRVYGKGKNSDIRDENLFSLTNKMSKKVMLTAAISWYGVIKPFLVNNNGIKVNKESYCPHLRKELFPAMGKIVKRDDRIFCQDGAPSHRSYLEQDFLKTKLKRRFIRAEEWPPSAPNVKSMDYFYWDFVKTKVYEGRSGKPFASNAQLK